jgi:hypothetical protein
MTALIMAYTAAERQVELRVTTATAIDGPAGRMLMFTIGETTAAFTIEETRWLADTLVLKSGHMGPLAGDLEHLGRALLTVLAEGPGPHGAH